MHIQADYSYKNSAKLPGSTMPVQILRSVGIHHGKDDQRQS
jgi:hypothetical protein